MALPVHEAGGPPPKLTRRPFLRPPPTAFLALLRPGEQLEVFLPQEPEVAWAAGSFKRLDTVGSELAAPALVVLDNVQVYNLREALEHIPNVKQLLVGGTLSVAVGAHVLRPTPWGRTGDEANSAAPEQLTRPLRPAVAASEQRCNWLSVASGAVDSEPVPAGTLPVRCAFQIHYTAA